MTKFVLCFLGVMLAAFPVVAKDHSSSSSSSSSESSSSGSGCGCCCD